MFENHLWQDRLLLIFAPDMQSEKLASQNQILKENKQGVSDREIIVWRFTYQESVKVGDKYKPHLSTNPFYRAYDIGRKDFEVILIGKDGEVKHRTQTPITASALFEIIDAMPMRQREMKKQRQ